MSPDPLVKVQDIKMHFPVKSGWGLTGPKAWVKAVDGVSLSVDRGATFGLVGESGCGKTTLGRCILRLLKPTGGRVVYNGEDITDRSSVQLRKLRQKMQIIFQDPFSSLDPRHTVEKIIAEPIKVHGLARGEARNNRLVELMDLVGLRPEHLFRYPHEFSGGQRQRICIARSLAVNPELIVADEPVSALDVSIQAQVLNLMVDLQEQFGLTYIFISHDLSVVRHISDHVAVMYLGKMVESARTGDLYNRPLHPYTQALLSAAPEPHPKKRGREIILEGDIPSPINPPAGCAFHPRCPRKTNICMETEPELTAKETGHLAACHHPGNG